ncbi:DNA polymerase I A, chloroplastic-like [Phragmites australis]|uniref:DNA polymerase I A, chloroplastic-like n=1 Tax=Phragmites australis TaxID=29695 RepID=UPI002D77A051|nr:DNA polymerase I A, chloroplastic-like [Phragmites australis]XP_062226899.1 DNA polymerase I A, chloroplastic-like [Phragmites australis]
MAMAGKAPAPAPALLGRCPCSAPPWAPSPFRSRRRGRSMTSPFTEGRRQEYSHSSGLGIQDNRALEFGVCVNFNVQSSAQEWAEESKRLSFIKTSNNVMNSICNGSTHLGAGILHHEPLEDYKSSIHSSLHSVRQRMAPNSLANRHANTELAKHHVINRAAGAVSALTSVVNNDTKPVNRPNDSEVEVHWPNGSKFHASLPKISEVETSLQFDDKASDGYAKDEHECSPKKTVQPTSARTPLSKESKDARKALGTIYEKILVVDDVKSARSIVQLLTMKYRNFIHACDTEVANIDVKQETPVGHGEVICFSIYSSTSGAEADFGNGKTCIWVDVLDGGQDVLMEFAPFFEDPSIRKVWHNYSFDSHVIENYGIKVAGFHADTMHLARLWDSSRRTDGGYSLEGLTNDHRVMGVVPKELQKIGKRSMKTIFGRKKIKKDGTEGKITSIEPVEILQREDREMWICYSSLDSMSTLRLYESLKSKLEKKHWTFDGCPRGSMYDFYEEYWRPFGAVLVKMETAGMLVDRTYLSEIEKVAVAQRKLAADKFRKWASKYCPDAKYMNVNSDTQIRQLFFGGIENRCKPGETLPRSKAIKVPNDDNAVAEGKKVPKYRTIELFSIVEGLKADIFTASGWPSVSGDALRSLAGKVPSDLVYTTNDLEDNECGSDSEISDYDLEDTSSYGTAYEAFGGGKKGKEACHAIAALCEICSIDSLISNFILPLQGNHISCKEGRIHCSLNINTETGRLSARTPNLQNQPALEKDRYKIRQAFVAAPGKTLIVADYGQLELRILAHLADCKSMLDAFKAGGDFHSRTAMNMYQHIREAVEEKKVLLEWHPQPGQEKPPVPLLKDAFGAERRKAKMLNFSIAYGKTAHGLARDWKVSVKEAKDTLKLWYSDRKEVLAWQMEQKELAQEKCEVYTLLGRSRRFPNMAYATSGQRGHIERAAINAPVQGSAADVAMCAMLEIDRNTRLKELGWTLLLQVHDEVILEGPAESADLAKAIVVECMSKPFYGTNILNVDLAVDAKCAHNWYAAK